MMKQLDFRPPKGLSSKHLQTIIAPFRDHGPSTHSEQWLVDIGSRDCLSCEISVPSYWEPHHETVVLIHGLGGSHASGYMHRLARLLTNNGKKVVRINLRGCGSGYGLSNLPYHAGGSHDIATVLRQHKVLFPHSAISLIGFSLGGNIALKLAGELGESAEKLIDTCIAICSPLDLRATARSIGQRTYFFYERYYVKRITEQANRWLNQKVSSIYEFDSLVTAPMWGYRSADDYYAQCSSIKFIPSIKCPVHLLFAEDDPFITLDSLHTIKLSPSTHIWTTKFGGHMGYIGYTAPEYKNFWMDEFIVKALT